VVVVLGAKHTTAKKRRTANGDILMVLGVEYRRRYQTFVLGY